MQVHAFTTPGGRVSLHHFDRGRLAAAGCRGWEAAHTDASLGKIEPLV